MAEEESNQNESNTQTPEETKAPDTPGENKDNSNSDGNSETKEKTLEEVENEIRIERQKELDLVKEKNKILEQQIRGRGMMFQDKSPEEKQTDDINKYLEGTGLKI